MMSHDSQDQTPVKADGGEQQETSSASAQWPLLLTWINFNPSMDK